MTPRRTLSVLLAAAATAAVIWAYASHRGTIPPGAVPIQDGKTLNFSNGSPQVGDSAADKAALDAAVREIDEATKNTTIPAQPTPAK